MADVYTPKKRSEVMRAIRSRANRDTELKLCDIMRAARIPGWRRNFPAYGKPDFCFPKQKLAVFVDGCFWHGCPKHGRKPASNSAYWETKLLRNKARDLAVRKKLRANGWRTMRIWEHDLSDRSKVIQRLTAKLMALPLAAPLRSRRPPRRAPNLKKP